MAALNPVPQPIGIFEQYIARQPETLVLKEKVISLSGDSFSIKLQNGTPLIQVEGKVMSISGRKTVRDMAGTHLFDIVKERLHLHATYAIKTPDNQKIMEVKSKFSFLGSKAYATFTSSNGKAEKLLMSGNWFDTRAEIVDEAQGNLVVGAIDRKLLSGKDILFGQQTYALQVAPGVDMALMAALCICMDEKNNEK
ncbi:tubby C-terminal-like domain-containing protein [Dendryphion nanum]|uniref:Tubby C-terminal-like domain-containing protein n=1 Tax=Dendryphion nanum TaxID=256645 RepID=A0A9P9IFF2_9PLEO|nr:tubby C-terminal-like domain-containing protein [Dendryphion nanum]